MKYTVNALCNVSLIISIIAPFSYSAVSLECNDTMEVFAGENVTLNCSIIYRPGSNCEGIKYEWEDTRGSICNSISTNYICGWDNLTYVYLTISNVIKEENYSIAIHADCGFPEIRTIKVQVHSKNNFGE